MHIAIDLRMVGPHLHGIARYALELSRRLPRLMPDSRFDLIVGRDFDPALLPSPGPQVRLVPARSGFLSAGEQLELPALLHKLKPDLFHSPSFAVPVAYRGPLAMTIHDANHLAFPEHYGHFHGHYYRHVVRPGAMRARLLLTVSEFARDEIERRLELPPERVRVIYNGVDGSFRPQPAETLEALRRRFDLPDRFVLYVGNTKPHKNVEQLVDAFRLMSTDLSLVLCAGPSTERLVERAGPSARRVRVIDGLAEDELPVLYAAARVFVFPSLYEGFGLPPLEAMACGTPVIATRATALPEVLGDAADFVEPGDVLGLAEAIARIDADEAHADRLRQAGFERAAGFSWDQTAETIAAAYQAVCSPLEVRSALTRGPVRPPGAHPVPGPRGAGLKVLFCVRQNLWSLPGGDATQILRTKASLEQLGTEVTLWTEPRAPAHGSFDLAHLFHLTRLDTFVQAQALTAAGLPFVLSTIFWPTSELERRGYSGALKLMQQTLPDGSMETVKNGIRAGLASGSWRWALLPGILRPLDERMRYLIEHARTLLPNSSTEADVLRGLGATRIDPVVNAADPPPANRPLPNLPLPERFVMCAGRIEPRKNQLALVQALAGADLDLVLVGNPGPLHGDYFSRVKAAVGPRTTLLPAYPREELFALYERAEAHVAPAWYETPGLVSLEAAAAGSRVVTTDRGSTREYFGDQAHYLDPSSQRSILEAVEAALASPRPEGLRERVLKQFTWERAASQTLLAYHKALAAPDASAHEPRKASQP